MRIQAHANDGSLTRVAQELRGVARRIAGRRGRLLVRRIWPRRWPITADYRERLKGRRALEIGGPTDLLGYSGPLTVYPCFKSLDSCNYAHRTLWRSEAVKYRRSLICEGTQLPLRDAVYDCVIASHCLEHMANPMKALLEWRRVLSPGGLVLLVLPHRDYTFDWRRPVTTLEHMQQDFQRGTPETDLSHLDEILALHDLARDPPAGTPQEFRERCLKNFEFRAMHHHVFVPETAAELVSKTGFSSVRQDVQEYHIIILGKKSGA